MWLTIVVEAAVWQSSRHRERSSAPELKVWKGTTIVNSGPRLSRGGGGWRATLRDPTSNFEMFACQNEDFLCFFLLVVDLIFSKLESQGDRVPLTPAEPRSGSFLWLQSRHTFNIFHSLVCESEADHIWRRSIFAPSDMTTGDSPVNSTCTVRVLICTQNACTAFTSPSSPKYPSSTFPRCTLYP